MQRKKKKIKQMVVYKNQNTDQRRNEKQLGSKDKNPIKKRDPNTIRRPVPYIESTSKSTSREYFAARILLSPGQKYPHKFCILAPFPFV